MLRTTVLTSSFFALLLIQGCAVKQPLYNWGPYERQVYAHFKGESPEPQIQILEAHAKVTKETGKVLPPGYMAHLGLLYGNAGRHEDFVSALLQEKQNFPESAPYVDTLLKRTKSESGNEKK